jgi:hypothetical protein
MGTPISEDLLKAGHTLLEHDLWPAATDELASGSRSRVNGVHAHVLHALVNGDGHDVVGLGRRRLGDGTDGRLADHAEHQLHHDRARKTTA